MEIVPMLGLGWICLWFVSAGSLVYLPIKVFMLKQKRRDIWLFLSRRRLLLSACAYVVSAPLLWLLGFLVSIAGVSGSHNVIFSDEAEGLAVAIAAVFLAAALVALSLVFIRRRPPRT